MSQVFVEAVGLAAPGLNSWADSMPVLRGDKTYEAAPLSTFAPTLLPANEQRRATATVRLAFRVAEEAIRNGGHSPDSLATVFASSDADMAVSHRICLALAQPQRLVSPTDFHNSVHNAPSGYWHIGAHSRLPSTAVAGHDYSFGVGLLEAMTQTITEGQTTLLVCYDVPAPEPLLDKRPLEASFAVALLLAPQLSQRSIAMLAVDELNLEGDETPASGALEALRRGNPAGRALPLLEALTRGSGEVILKRSSARSMRVSVARRAA